MMSINFVMHVFSAIAFVVLTYLFIETKKNQSKAGEYVRLFSSGSLESFVAASPQKFLRHFAKTFHIEFSEHSTLSTELTKINTAPWVRAHFQHEMLRIETSSKADNKQTVNITFKNQQNIDANTLQKLKASLGAHTEITL